MYVSIAMIRVIAAELHKHGVSEARFCMRTGVSRAELADATEVVPVWRYDEIVRGARELSGDPDLGLHVGESLPTGGAHVVGQILQSCASVRDAIALFIRFAPLVIEGARLSLREDHEGAAAVYAHPEIAADNARFDAEAALVLVLGIGKRFLRSDNPPYRVRFAHPAPASIAEHLRIFRCPIDFDAPSNEMLFSPRLLDLPQAYRDEPVCELLKAHAEALLARRRGDDRLPERVFDLLRSGVDPGEVAHRLGLGERSLQRRLRERGVSLSQLFDDARKDIACRALAGPEDPIKELAARLGFSEPSAFHRAFKRWMGQTPAEYRRLRLGSVRSGSG
jgi:AraC-like DNA-binding protein